MKKLTFIFAFLLGLLPAHAQKLIFPQTPGMVSYTYRNSFAKNVAATLDTIKALAITDMEFSNLFGKTAADIRKLLDERGMNCSSLTFNRIGKQLHDEFGLMFCYHTGGPAQSRLRVREIRGRNAFRLHRAAYRPQVCQF